MKTVKDSPVSQITDKADEVVSLAVRKRSLPDGFTAHALGSVVRMASRRRPTRHALMVLGIAAAAGFVCLLHGALIYHARAGDLRRHGRRAEALAPGVLLMIVTGLTGALLMSVL